MAPDDGDGVHLFAIDGQQAMVVFQQDRTLLGDLARCLQATLDVHYTFVGRMVDDSAGELRPENATYVVVDL